MAGAACRGGGTSGDVWRAAAAAATARTRAATGLASSSILAPEFAVMALPPLLLRAVVLPLPLSRAAALQGLKHEGNIYARLRMKCGAGKYYA